MTAYVKGDKDLLAKLAALKKTEAKAAIRKGTRAGAKIVKQRAAELASSKTGTLKRTIKVRALPRSKKWTGNDIKLEIFYGSFVEFGTKFIKGKHFLEQAADDVGDEAKDVAIDTIKAEVEARMKG